MHQLRAIQQALELIEDHLTDSISLETIARRIGMSRWHFQRTFTAMVGEPAGSYLRRRRLAEAGRSLHETERSILTVALDYQFESHEAFTRAFKAEMSLPPSVWRQLPSCRSVGLQRILLTAETLHQRYLHMNLVPEIVTLPTRTFVGLQAPFIVALSPHANNLEIIPKLWDDFVGRLKRHDVDSNEPAASYGLCDRPESLGAKASRADEALYLAAVQVATEAIPPRGMVKWTSPAGSYAKFTHRGPVGKIGQTMGFIYGKWFSDSGYDRGSGPDLERMDERFNPQAEDSILEIFIPIRPRRKK